MLPVISEPFRVSFSDNTYQSRSFGTGITTFKLFRSNLIINPFQKNSSSSQISGDTSLVINETHLFHENGLWTKIQLGVNIAMKSTYGCEIIMQDKSFCSKTKIVDYEGGLVYLS